MMALGPLVCNFLSDPTVQTLTFTGKYEGKGTGYDDGKWAPGKYEGGDTGYDDGQYHGEKAKRNDDGKWYPGK
jgi:hypothetical protein